MKILTHSVEIISVILALQVLTMLSLYRVIQTYKKNKE